MNVLIVGATRGIGLGFVKHYLKDSSVKALFATYRQPDTAQDLFALQSGNDSILHLIPWDVSEDEDFVNGISTIEQVVSTLDVVIYCAGILHQPNLSPEKSLRHVTREGLHQYFEVNSIGGVLLANHVMPLIKHKNRSVLAFISAKVGSIEDNRLGGWYGYRASKAALNMFIKTMAIEYGRRSPQTLVLSLHPGTTDSDLSKPFQRSVPPEKLFSVECTVQQLIRVIAHAKQSGQFLSWDGSLIPW